MSPQMDWTVQGSSAAELYERYLVPTLFTPWATELVALAALKPGERVLDVACGTGAVTRLAAQRVGSTGTVTGLDVTPGMLAVARVLPPPSGAPIAWHEGTASAMPLADAAFDMVLCQQGVQFFPERATALREMHRVLVPGGRLALSVWRAPRHNPYVEALAAVIAHYLGPEAGASMRTPCAFGELEALRTVVTGGGFQEVRIRIAVRLLRFPSVEEFIPGQLAAIPLAGAIAALDTATRAALLTDIREALWVYKDDEGFAVPMEAYVVIAQA
jgi:SAM-dependent methyltransferase